MIPIPPPTSTATGYRYQSWWLSPNGPSTYICHHGNEVRGKELSNQYSWYNKNQLSNLYIYIYTYLFPYFFFGGWLNENQIQYGTTNCISSRCYENKIVTDLSVNSIEQFGLVCQSLYPGLLPHKLPGVSCCLYHPVSLLSHLSLFRLHSALPPILFLAERIIVFQKGIYLNFLNVAVSGPILAYTINN